MISISWDFDNICLFDHFGFDTSTPSHINSNKCFVSSYAKKEKSKSKEEKEERKKEREELREGMKKRKKEQKERGKFD